MDKDSLIQQRSEVERQFEVHKSELLHLQGEFRLLNQLIDSFDDKKTKVSPAANVIDADAALKEKDNAK